MIQALERAHSLLILDTSASLSGSMAPSPSRCLFCSARTDDNWRDFLKQISLHVDLLRYASSPMNASVLETFRLANSAMVMPVARTRCITRSRLSCLGEGRLPNSELPESKTGQEKMNALSTQSEQTQPEHNLVGSIDQGSRSPI